VARRGFGDDTWRLAKEGNTEALRGAAARLGDDVPYDAHRARAFALAVEARRDEALAELNEGWTEDWPVPGQYAVDVARIHYLAGDCAHALAALDLSVRSAHRRDGAPAELAAECARREPHLWWHALRVALAAGSLSERGRTAVAVVVARLAR
jgi:hypothetical protein